MGFETLPRVPLAYLPTPLDEAKNLRKAIGGPRLFFKRDDLTGLGCGGNKLRKLEFLLGDALSKKADTIVTSGAIQTNHGRLTAAACAKLGLDCILVLTERETGSYEGNRILVSLFGAKQVFADVDYSVAPDKLDKEKLRAGDEKIAQIMSDLKNKGKRPYLIPRGGRSLQGTAGYCCAMVELTEQMASFGIQADHIIVPCATSSTLTGVLLGSRVCSLKAKVHGVALSRSPAEGMSMVEEEFNRDAKAMGYPYHIDKSEITIYGGYIGKGYAIPTEMGRRAIQLLAKTEGILLDPVYTSKTMSAYLDLVEKGILKNDETVIFLHTGGLPLLFLKEVSQWISDEQRASM